MAFKPKWKNIVGLPPVSTFTGRFVGYTTRDVEFTNGGEATYLALNFEDVEAIDTTVPFTGTKLTIEQKVGEHENSGYVAMMVTLALALGQDEVDWDELSESQPILTMKLDPKHSFGDQTGKVWKCLEAGKSADEAPKKTGGKAAVAVVATEEEEGGAYDTVLDICVGLKVKEDDEGVVTCADLLKAAMSNAEVRADQQVQDAIINDTFVADAIADGALKVTRGKLQRA